MGKIYSNSGLVISMQSAIGSAVAITGITKADPGVLTSTAHSLVDGDLVLLRALGMIEINERVYEVVNKTNNTFELKNTDTGSVGIDTSLFGAFTSSTFEKLTMGITMNGVQEFTGNGGEIKFEDSTTVNDIRDKQLVVGSTPVSYNLQLQWDPSDPAQAEMLKAFELLASRAFRITWPDGRAALFYGSIGFPGNPGGSKQGITTTPGAIAMNGAPVFTIP